MSTKLKSRLTDKLLATKTPDSDQEEQEVKSPNSSVSKEEDKKSHVSDEETPYEPILSNVARKLPLHGLASHYCINHF